MNIYYVNLPSDICSLADEMKLAAVGERENPNGVYSDSVEEAIERASDPKIRGEILAKNNTRVIVIPAMARAFSLCLTEEDTPDKYHLSISEIDAEKSRPKLPDLATATLIASRFFSKFTAWKQPQGVLLAQHFIGEGSYGDQEA